MKKLSELDNCTMLIVGKEDGEVMSKEDYMENIRKQRFHNEKIYLAYEEAQRFDWKYVIDLLEDDQYEDWADDVVSDIYNNSDLMRAEKIIKDIFESYPTYYPAELIENDMFETEKSWLSQIH